MNYLDKHKSYLKSQGSSIRDQLFNSTVDLINQSFEDSPSYTVVKINGVNVGVRIMDITNTIRSDNIEPIRFNNKYILFRPHTKVNIGDIVEYADKVWIVTDFQINDLYPNAKISQTNNILKFQIGETKVKKGVDKLGRPVYAITPIFVDPPQYCTIRLDVSSVGLNSDVNLPKERIIITISYNQYTKLIKENDVLDVNNAKYKVTNFDYTPVINEVGAMDIYAERVV